MPSVLLQRVLDGQQGLGAGEIHIVGVQIVEVVPVVDGDLLVLLHAEHLGSVRHGIAQNGHGLTGQSEGRLAVVHAPEILPALGGVSVLAVGSRTHGGGERLCHVHDLLLPPMAVGGVVVIDGQAGEDVDILGVDALCLLQQRRIVHGGVAVFLREEVVLIGDEGVVGLVHLGVAVDDGVELVDGQLGLSRLEGIVQLAEVTVHVVEVVVVLHAQHLVLEVGLQPAEGVPQGELVQKVGFQIVEVVAAEHVLHGQFRQLGQLAPLSGGEFAVRQDHMGSENAHQRQGHGGHHQILFQFFHR